jgi:agmatine/peptidylarginine deiminase
LLCISSWFLDRISLFIDFKNVEMMLSKETHREDGNDAVIHNSIEKSLIVLCAPTVDCEYYSSKFTEIIDYIVNFVNLVNGKDDVVILANADTLPRFEGRVSSDILIQAAIVDIWIRDFSPVIPSKQIKFKFSPAYLSTSDAQFFQNSFDEWFEKNGLEYYVKSDIILDGGNLVENTAGTRVIVTDRILRDNPSLTKSDAKNKLKQLLGINEIAIIPETPNRTTGHADGIVMWPMDDKILILKRIEPAHTEGIHELKNAFPGVEIVEMPNYVTNSKWEDFSSAHNAFVNCLVTDGYIYMPTFNGPHDTEMIELVKSHTNKMVVPIPVENIAMMGGTVRCLTWQVKKANKTKILQLIKH